MGSTTQVITFSDIYTEVLNKMRQPTGVTAIVEQAKRGVNTALHDMVFGFEYKLPWLERDAVLLTHAPYTEGTVTITQGGVTLNGTDTFWGGLDAYQRAQTRQDGKFIIAGPNVYTVDSVTSNVQLTLKSRFVSDDTLTDSPYVYFEDEYPLASDFLKMIDMRRFSQALDIPLIGRNEFRRMYPRTNVGGTPRVATLLDKTFNGSTTPVIVVQFYPYPSSVVMIPYSYITKNLAVSSAGVEATHMTNDTDEPALPVRYRNALVSYAIWKWYRDKKDDARSELAKADYQEEVNRIVGDQRIGANTGAQVQPRAGYYASRSVYRGGSGRRFSTNNSFDDFRT